jgi:hypothetical protein
MNNHKRYTRQSVPGSIGSAFWTSVAVAICLALGYIGALVDPIVGVLGLVGGLMFFFYTPSPPRMSWVSYAPVWDEKSYQTWENIDLRKRLYLDL